jgi:2-oxoglutarate dehydrogenase E2 component (dihydrolipoamide succinyltransferase)
MDGTEADLEPTDLESPESNPDTSSQHPEDDTEPTIKTSPAVRSLLAENQMSATEIKAKQQPDRITKADVLEHLAVAITNNELGSSDAVVQPTHSDQGQDIAEEDVTDEEDVIDIAIPSPATTETESSPAAVETAEVPAQQETPPVVSTNTSTSANISTNTSTSTSTSANISASADQRPQKKVPMTELRTHTMAQLPPAQKECALLTTFNEVNMQGVIDLRQHHKKEFKAVHGVRLGFMSFFTLAVVAALKRFPILNACIEGTDIVYHEYFDIGIAVSSECGLRVPILRDANTLSPADIEHGIKVFAEKADADKLTNEELTGGTFTITNGGIFGSLLSTPIINPPQSAVLGMHTIQQRPIAENDQIVIRPMMYLALSYDHRIIDGRDAVQFLAVIKENIECPARLLLHI